MGPAWRSFVRWLSGGGEPARFVICSDGGFSLFLVNRIYPLSNAKQKGLGFDQERFRPRRLTMSTPRHSKAVTSSLPVCQPLKAFFDVDALMLERVGELGSLTCETSEHNCRDWTDRQTSQSLANSRRGGGPSGGRLNCAPSLVKTS